MNDRTSVLESLYAALESGDGADALALMADDVEWIEPAAVGYPLAGTHRGVDDVAGAVVGALAGNVVVDRIVVDDDHGVATGRLTVDEVEVPFAHVCEVHDGAVARVRSFADTSVFTPAAVRSELADLAEQLLDEADNLRRHCEGLAREETPATADGITVADAPGAEASLNGSTRSLRLEAVDLAQAGADRTAVEQFLAAHLDDAASVAALLEDIFPAKPTAANGSSSRFTWTRR